MDQNDPNVIQSVKHWFEDAVLGLNLCPFAARPYQQGGIQFEISQASDDENCLIDVYLNLTKLDQQQNIETLILICPYHLQDFNEYNQFLALADQLLQQEGWDGSYQIASFHPDYRFADSAEDDLSNWTNRAPYPLLHLLRESSIEQAVKSHKAIDSIPQQNIGRLKNLTEKELLNIFGRRFQAKKNRG